MGLAKHGRTAWVSQLPFGFCLTFDSPRDFVAQEMAAAEEVSIAFRLLSHFRPEDCEGKVGFCDSPSQLPFGFCLTFDCRHKLYTIS